MRNLGRKGFTMLEMLTVLSIMGVLVSFAISTMHGYLARTKLRTTVETIAADIRQARWLARTSSSSCTMVFDTTMHAYTINGSQHTKLPAGVRFGIGPGVSGKPADPYEAPPADGVSFDSGGRKNQALFNFTGMVSPTGAVYVTDGTDTMVVTVAITGRPKIWRSGGGHKWIAL